MSSLIEKKGAVFQEGPSARFHENRKFIKDHCEKYKNQKIEQIEPFLEGKTLKRFYLLGLLYEGSRVTAGGIEIPDEVIDNDRDSTKAFLIVKMGDYCFDEDAATEEAPMRRVIDIFSKEDRPKLHDWFMARPCDGMPIKVGSFSCKLFQDRDVIMKLDVPQDIF